MGDGADETVGAVVAHESAAVLVEGCASAVASHGRRTPAQDKKDDDDDHSHRRRD
ncbi:MAG TPA: hypothetical protein VGO62_07365 [Myxococcota bacterium]